jgi:hypothetical protein
MFSLEGSEYQRKKEKGSGNSLFGTERGDRAISETLVTPSLRSLSNHQL